MAAELPIPDITTSAHPAEQYAALRTRGVHRSEDGWVIARQADVAAALACPALSVAPAHQPSGPAAQLQARMARFCDGAERARRRTSVEDALPGVDGLERAATTQATALLAARSEPFDVMPLARTVPVAVLAAALGVAAADIAGVVTSTAALCDGLAGRLDPTAADEAAHQLLALLKPLGSPDRVVALASMLFQTRDATAALIGLTVAQGDTLCDDPPVHCTRRTSTQDVELGGALIGKDEPVWVLLAAVEGATFGAGTHACPGRAIAEALAGGVVEAVRAHGWTRQPGQSVSYQPRPNLRQPAHLILERR